MATNQRAFGSLRLASVCQSYSFRPVATFPLFCRRPPEAAPGIKKFNNSFTVGHFPIGQTNKQTDKHHSTLIRGDPSEANINTLIVELMVRMSRLETENRELKGKMEQNSGRNEGNGPNWTGAMDNLEKIPGQVDKGTILVLGGIEGGNWSDKMAILKQDKWIKLALKLPKELREGGAVYLDGEIYIFGGIRMDKELYKLDNKTLKWIRLADMNEGRRRISNSSVEWNGSIWVFGGYDVDKMASSTSVERYDPKTNKWINMPDMKYMRNCAAAAVHNGKFIVCGGYPRLKSVECFDPESGVWTKLNDMPTPLFWHSLVSYGNNLILMGGWDLKTTFNTVLELSNLEGKGTWKELPPMKQPRFGFSATVLDNEIFVIGGSNGTDKSLDETEIFNGKSWREGPQLPNWCSSMSSIVIPRHLADIFYNYKE